jgi:serine/threonine protein kinase
MSFEQGELNDAEAAPVEEHIRECTDCAAALNEIRHTDPDTQMLRLVFQKADTDLSIATAGTDVLRGALSDVSHAGAKPQGARAAIRGDEAAQPASGGDGAGPTAPAAATWNIPDYERIALCGEGSYGSVWAVRDRVGVYRALKAIDLDRLERAKIKCYELSALETYCRKVTRHPYLITVYHVGEAGRCLYYTMELADDQRRHGAVGDPFPADYRPMTLATLIRGGRLRVDIAVEIARRLLGGLAKLHELNLIHRDIKPSNIIFVNRYPKLADIGILTAEEGWGKPIGTPNYMPPDRAKDKTADIYAIGTVLREMIEGRRTGSADPAAYESAKWDPDRVREVIARARAEQAADRYPTASAMLEDLEACRYLTEGSLFDELDELFSPPPPTKPNVAVQLAFALIDRLPWIAGLIVLLYVLSKLW